MLEVVLQLLKTARAYRPPVVLTGIAYGGAALLEGGGIAGSHSQEFERIESIEVVRELVRPHPNPLPQEEGIGGVDWRGKALHVREGSGVSGETAQGWVLY